MPRRRVREAGEPASDPVQRNLRLAWRATGRGFIEFYRSDNLTHASSIAFFSLLSLFPFFLLLLSIVSRFTVGQRDDRILEILQRALPGQFDFLSNQIHSLAAGALQLGVAGTLFSLLGSLGVFGAVTAAVNHAWHVETPVGFFRGKLKAFVMLGAAGLLMVLALLLVGAVEVADTGWFASLLSAAPRLGTLTNWMFGQVPTALFILVVGLIYYYVPNTKVWLRDVWYGAVLAGVLWRLAFEVFAWFVHDSGRLSVHGSIQAVVAFLLWVYVSAVILLYGVEVTAAYHRLRRVTR